MPTLLLEIGLLDLPSRFVLQMQNQLAESVSNALLKEHLEIKILKAFSTTRRIGILAECPERQPDIEEIILGPPKTIAIDANGSWTRAAEGFVKKNGIRLEDCAFFDGQKGECLGYKIQLKGESAIDVLAKTLPISLNQIESPLKMKWGDGSFEFLRPIQWILAMLNGNFIPFSWMGKSSGNRTFGHLIYKPIAIEIKEPESYESLLKERGFVFVDREIRKAVIMDGLKKELRKLRGEITLNDANENLLNILTDSVEFPTIINGKFPAEYLSLPAEVIDTVLREHQHFFMVHDKKKNPMPFFIAVSDIPRKSKDIVLNYESVTVSRLKDALFFFDKDIKKPLLSYRGDLSGIVFHNKLGSYFDKIKRLKELVSFITEELNNENEGLNLNREKAERSATLSKCDLATNIIGEKELTSLQGIYGEILAGISDEDEDVCRAIGDQYKQEIDAINNPQSIPLYIADRIDNITGFLRIGVNPSSSKDPFGLRRSANEIIRILINSKKRIDLRRIIIQSIDIHLNFPNETSRERLGLIDNILNYIWGRLGLYLLQFNINKEIIKSTLESGALLVSFTKTIKNQTHNEIPTYKYDIYDTYLRAIELDEAYKQNPDDYSAIGIAFKRAYNIIQNQELKPFYESLLREEEEKSLYNKFMEVKEECEPLFNVLDYSLILSKMRQLRYPIDRFFDKVLVLCDNDGSNPELRSLQENRISLLFDITILFLRIADFSHLYGTINYGEKE